MDRRKAKRLLKRCGKNARASTLRWMFLGGAAVAPWMAEAAFAQELPGTQPCDPAIRLTSAEVAIAQPATGRNRIRVEGEAPAPSTNRAPQGQGQRRAPAEQQNQPQPAPPQNAPSNNFASSPQSAAPNMIGDFFGGPPSVLGIPAGPGLPQPIVIEFQPAGGQPGQNNPIVAGPNEPVNFLVVPGNFNGVATPGTFFMSTDSLMNLTPAQFGLTAGDPAFQAAIAAGNVAAFGPGSTTFQGGQAVLTLDDGITGISPADQYAVRQSTTYTPLFTPVETVILIPNPGAGAGVGIVKVAENNSPIPRNRVYLNYSYFDNVNFFQGGVNVNRFTPGFEKTFLDDQMSIEVRAPFASTLDSNIIAGGFTDTSHLEFGNLTMVLKAILYGNDEWTFTGGLWAAAPTADDVTVNNTAGTPLIAVKNESVHIAPYLAALWTPNDRFFSQTFISCDIDLNGNPVSANTGAGLAPIGRLNDPALLFVDMGLGYWLYRGQNERFITGMAPIFEAHYNASLADYDRVALGNFQIGDRSQNFDVLNLTFGLNMMVGEQSNLVLGYTTPVGEGVDKQFDGELRVLFNYFFDRPTRQNRIDF